jgi:transposase
MQGKVPLEQSAPARVYVGIDVCKDWLDVHVHPIGQAFRIPNTRTGLRQLKRRLAGRDVALLAMEATGKFHRQAHRNLHASGFRVAIVNPLRSRLFARAIGQLAKTDKVDARMLALLAAMLDPKAKAPPSEACERLQEIVRGREAFLAQRTALLNQLAAATASCVKQMIRRQLKTLEPAITRLAHEIEVMIRADPALARRFAILTSIPGLGAATAAGLLANFPELGACTAKQAAMIAGLAPIADDSGSRTGERRIKGGRAGVRTGLYMAALAAARFNADMQRFYGRLRANGKKPKVALTAVMRKLLVLANTLIHEDRLWQPIHA